MERRFFLRASSFSILSALTTRLHAHWNPNFLDTDFQPYSIDLSDPDVQQTLNGQSLINTIRIHSTRQTPDKAKWMLGEGKTGFDNGFQAALDRHNQRVDAYYAYSGVHTPVTLLKTPTHIVYGQFFRNQTGNFQYGCIKGLDGVYYLVDPTFRRVFTYKYNCYGLPAADYEQLLCSKCGEWHIRQLFQRVCDQQKIMLYAYPDCNAGGHHDFIQHLKPFEPCGVKDDALKVGAEF